MISLNALKPLEDAKEQITLNQMTTVISQVDSHTNQIR